MKYPSDLAREVIEREGGLDEFYEWLGVETEEELQELIEGLVPIIDNES